MNKKQNDDRRSFIVLFDDGLAVEKRKDIASSIGKLPKVQSVDLSDEKRVARLKVVVSDGRSRRRIMREVKQMPGVYETELITYMRTQ
ncbi:MAG: hypothetical protein K2Y22_06360 [Candidatus Obscuribacterales bacterium]|nr:hypothetical protein [Candidatus Obscuribacterales bacterium]